MPKFSVALFEERKALVSLFDGMSIAGDMSEPWRIDYHPNGRGEEYRWAYIMTLRERAWKAAISDLLNSYHRYNNLRTPAK